MLRAYASIDHFEPGTNRTPPMTAPMACDELACFANGRIRFLSRGANLHLNDHIVHKFDQYEHFVEIN
jgi:hypothetical protein